VKARPALQAVTAYAPPFMRSSCQPLTAAPSALRVHELMQASPIVTIQTVCEKLGISFPTAGTALENLVKIGVVRETTGRQRGRIYAYSDYLALLDRGTDPLPA
jgi:hypothetical protein